MMYHAFMLLQGEKVHLEVDPNAINTVAVSLEDGSTIYAVAGASEEKKLISLQKHIEEEKTIFSLMQIRDEISTACFSGALIHTMLVPAHIERIAKGDWSITRTTKKT